MNIEFDQISELIIGSGIPDNEPGKPCNKFAYLLT